MKELIGQYADQWKDKGGIYSLAQGVVYWKPPKSAVQAIQSALTLDEDDDDDDNNNNNNNSNNKNAMLHMYGPDEGLLELRQVLQNKIATENGLTNHSVMVTVGANQAYVNCVLTLLDQHHKAVVFAPYYFNHCMALQMTLPDNDSLLIGPTCLETGYPDLEWLEQRLQNDPTIHMVTLANPCNPTGIHLPRDYVQQVVDLCRQYDCWLVLDATYEYFTYHDNNSQAFFDGCFEDPHVIHIFSLSKAYSLAGYRCGYIAVSDAATGLYDNLMKVQDTIPICPSRISQMAALGALQGAGPEWVRDKVATLETGKQAILQALTPLSEIIGGSGAMYVMGKLPLQDDEQVARKLVRDYGVAVIPGSFCGFPGWIRVCYANLPPQECERAAERLKKGIAEICDAVVAKNGQDVSGE